MNDESRSDGDPEEDIDALEDIAEDEHADNEAMDETLEEEIDQGKAEDVFEKPSVDLKEAEDVDVNALKPILESAVLAAGEALSIERMQAIFAEDAVPGKAYIREALEAIQIDCEGRGFELKEVASGWRFQVRDTYATWVNRLWEEKPQKYSRALLETLSLIAYRQPITRGDIEEVRGVAVSSHIIKTLSERDWVKVVGHRDVPGRPALYATTKIFLDYFNLSSLEELPTLGELKDIDGLNQKLDLDEGTKTQDSNEAVQTEDSITAETDNSKLDDSEEAYETSRDNSEITCNTEDHPDSLTVDSDTVSEMDNGIVSEDNHQTNSDMPNELAEKYDGDTSDDVEPGTLESNDDKERS